MHTLVYSQKGHNFIYLYVRKKDIDCLMGRNLKRMRLERLLTQERLAELLGISQGLIPKLEGGTKGIGKNLLTRLCSILKVRPYEFYIEKDTPLVNTDLEKKALYMVREAEKMQVAYIAEEAIAYTAHRVDTVKKQAEQGTEPRRAPRAKARNDG